MTERQAALLRHAVNLLDEDGEHDATFDELDQLRSLVEWMALPARGRSRVSHVSVAPPPIER